MIVNGYKGFLFVSLGEVGLREVVYSCSRAQFGAQRRALVVAQIIGQSECWHARRKGR